MSLALPIYSFVPAVEPFPPGDPREATGSVIAAILNSILWSIQEPTLEVLTMKTKTKLELTWIGKENRPKLEPPILLEDSEKSGYLTPAREVRIGTEKDR